MVQIDEVLLRGRAEHNDRCLANLKEISLHQQNIESINRALTRMCPELEILYLQHNLISKIENLRRLRDLDYLNMALNNVTEITGLERNEKLRKLDLTVNFIDLEGLLTIERLRVNHQLEELYMVGNPCAEFQGYRLYVIGSLPQLTRLDGNQITASERIQANQQLPEIRARLVVAAKERVRAKGGDPTLVGAELVPDQEVNSDGEEELYGWSAEIRTADYKRDEKKKQKEKEEEEERQRQRDPMKAAEDEARLNRSFFRQDGTPRHINDGKWPTKVDDDFKGNIVVRIELPKFMDSSLLDMDVQPNYIRITVKKPEKHDKYIQVPLPEEVRVDNSEAQRSQVTGELVITCPKLHYDKSEHERQRGGLTEEGLSYGRKKDKEIATLDGKGKVAPGSSLKGSVRVSGMLADPASLSSSDIKPAQAAVPGSKGKKDEDSDFEDDPDCPPLE